MDHPKHIVLPHLGASTEEAEENSAAMAADTIKDFLEHGIIRNSVNFPSCELKPKPESVGGRLCVVNKNQQGVLGQITTFLGKQGINITQQINVSRGNIAYTVLDMGDLPDGFDGEKMQKELGATCDGVVSSRIIGTAFMDAFGTPGTNFEVSWSNNN